jgi:2,4-dienoyl-CoA reductase-like NADH-dependent reductase (Old Yellow Enzyme family)
MQLSRVFKPIKIGSVEIPNRIVRTAHGTHFSTTCLTDDFIAYHEARARGGCGLTILEIASVHPSSVGSIRNFDDSIVSEYQKLVNVINPYGMKLFQQLHHGGAHFPGIDGLSWSASDVPGLYGSVPQPMGRREIETIIEAFAAAAERCKRGGLDGVEIHGAHGYLFHQFLSTVTNKRTDEYGGSLENRMRFLMETMRAVRSRVGPDFVVGIRLSATEAPVGVNESDNHAIIRALEEEELIDYVNVSLGDYYRIASMTATMESPSGYELPSSAPIAAASTLPRIVAGRFRTLEEAEEVLKNGDADMVSIVRAQIADPDLVQKTLDGRIDEIRPCIGCNQGCIGGLYRGGKMGCLVNPAVGFETTLSEDLITKTVEPRRVFVVGGGPAGMEAARVAAKAGHKVVLFEASPNLGGTIRVAMKAPNMSSVGDIMYWLEREVYRLGVDIRLNTYVDSQDMRDQNPDVLIVATGATQRKDGVQTLTPWVRPKGVDLPHVYTSIELLTNLPKMWGKKALVLDDVGHLEAIAVVDTLMAQDMEVTLVTRHPMMTPYVDSTQRTIPAGERFSRGRFRLMVDSHLEEIEADACSVRHLRGAFPESVEADLVVLVTPNSSNNELYMQLRDELPDVRRIGDAASPRDIQAAIADGRRTAMAIK